MQALQQLKSTLTSTGHTLGRILWNITRYTSVSNSAIQVLKSQ
jgi:hypothetical protein